jgi:flagellar protein FliO/FliZ
VSNGLAPVAAVPVAGLLQLSLSLAVVVGLIFAVSWLLKRFNLTAPRASRAMAVLDELAVGPRDRLLLVRVGQTQVLLGVGANGVVSMTPLSAVIEVPSTAPVTSFAARLREMMNRSGDDR